ncbi:MAG TPA: hypothetical protein VIO64_11095 [Pseudobacteroides sp.]|uniref:hypothetical protein n=1 Tax=Pseudobacteroides sp. TaxID=1968840 RepID=UPI002F94F7E7
MKLYGRIVRDTIILKDSFVVEEDTSLQFRERLEKCLIDLCREIGIPVPIWLEKNTREFAYFKRTFFTNEQFVEKVNFDKFEIRLE